MSLDIFAQDFPILKSENFVLRSIVNSDDAQYLEMMSDAQIKKYLSDEDIPQNLQEAQSEIRFWGGLFYRKQTIFWAIADRSTDKLIGTIGYNYWNFTNRRADITYELKKEYRRRGIMNDAIQLVMNFGIDKMNLYRIEAHTMQNNTPSENLLKKIGFEKEGILRGYRIVRGSPRDINLYSITSDTYKRR